MKVSYNGIQIRETRLCDISTGQPFFYEHWNYMKIDLNGKGIVDSWKRPTGMIPAVNLCAGTTRLIKRDEVVIPLQGKVQLRDQVMHRSEENEDEG